jgi:uncharacterized protein
MRADAPTYEALRQETPESLQAKLAASPEEAARWVEAAAHSGSKPAIVNWAQMLLDGHGTRRDPEAAFRWFRIAADTGYPDGINMVGRCHELGWGTPVDLEEAARCYNLAAALGHHWAKFNLGVMLVAGSGVKRDLATALSLFVASARAGNHKAMNMIGRYCEEGWHGRSKPAAAMRWYARAAFRGCFRGQFHLARFYASAGRIEEAEAWLLRSIDGAPADFCGEIAPLLERHPHRAIQALATRAAAKAGDAMRAGDAGSDGGRRRRSRLFPALGRLKRQR